jgi:cystathionine gamma-synthase
MMKVTDVRKIVEIAKERDLKVIVDNTFLTPYYQKPLELGADIVVHSGTKFLGGHNDALAGFVVTNSDEINDKIRFYQKSTGAVLAPFDSWLLLRGMKTLHLRMDKSQENAIKIANYLNNHHKVKEVFYVGLPDHKGYEISKSQATGFGAMISFNVYEEEQVAKILKNVEVITFAESLGGVETLITYPQTQTHAEIPEEIKNKLGITKTLLRLSVGIENVEDLIKDLEKALG